MKRIVWIAVVAVALLLGTVMTSSIAIAHIPASQTLICPNCEQKYRYWSSASGNNFGAVWFSDLKYVAPMRTVFSPVHRYIVLQVIIPI